MWKILLRVAQVTMSRREASFSDCLRCFKWNFPVIYFAKRIRFFLIFHKYAGDDFLTLMILMVKTLWKFMLGENVLSLPPPNKYNSPHLPLLCNLSRSSRKRRIPIRLRELRVIFFFNLSLFAQVTGSSDPSCGIFPHGYLTIFCEWFK